MSSTAGLAEEAEEEEEEEAVEEKGGPCLQRPVQPDHEWVHIDVSESLPSCIDPRLVALSVRGILRRGLQSGHHYATMSVCVSLCVCV